MILMVDDESKSMDSYRAELELSGYAVEYCDNVDAALQYFDKTHDQIQILILDIMMPPGRAFRAANTQDGLRTGVLFYERVRLTAPELKVVILTNVSDRRLAEQFEREPHAWFLNKEQFLPFELAQEVEKLIGAPPNQA